MNSSGDETARVRASRSKRPGARSSRCATASAGSPARRATSSTNSLSISVQPRASAARLATAEPPEPYWRVMVMMGAMGISREEVRSPTRTRPRLAKRPLRLHPHPRVAQLFAARDALFGDEPLEDQLARRDHRRRVLLGREPRVVHEGEQARYDAEPLETRLRPLVGADLQGPALVEPVDDVVHVGPADPGLERLARGAADQLLGDRLRPLQLALVLQLQLAGDRRQRGVHVRHPWHHGLFLGDDGAPLGVGDDVLEHGDRQALRYAAALVHALENVVSNAERRAIVTK